MMKILMYFTVLIFCISCGLIAEQDQAAHSNQTQNNTPAQSEETNIPTDIKIHTDADFPVLWSTFLTEYKDEENFDLMKYYDFNDSREPIADAILYDTYTRETFYDTTAEAFDRLDYHGHNAFAVHVVASASGDELIGTTYFFAVFIHGLVLLGAEAYVEH